MLVEGEDSDEFGLLNTSITAQRPTVKHTLMSQAPASYCRSHSFGWKCIKCSWPAAWLTVTACVLLLLTALSVWYSAAAFSVPFALMGCRKFCILLWLRSLFLTLLEHFDLIVLNAYIICGHKHKASESPDTPSASSWKWWVSVSAPVIILRFDFSFWGVFEPFVQIYSVKIFKAVPLLFESATFFCLYTK